MRSRFIQAVLISTGILMLVLSVLPHHHHGHAICFSSIEQCTQSCSNEHNPDTQHKHSESDTECDLRQLFLFSGRDDHQHGSTLCVCTNADQHDVLDVTLPILWLCDRIASDHNEQHPYKYPPLIEPLGSSVAGSLSALRAPPVFIA